MTSEDSCTSGSTTAVQQTLVDVTNGTDSAATSSTSSLSQPLDSSSSSASVQKTVVDLTTNTAASSTSSLSQTPPRRHGILSRAPSSHSLNVKFAPLPDKPEISKKRKSAPPLGVASRTNMIQRRRMMMDAYGKTPEEVEEELEDYRQRKPYNYDEEYLEDPFVVLGKLVKGAWKKIHGKKDKATGGGVVVAGTTTASEKPSEGHGCRELEGDGDGDGQGGVWEEEAKVRPSNVRQSVNTERNSSSTTSSSPSTTPPPVLPPKDHSESSSDAAPEKSAGS